MLGFDGRLLNRATLTAWLSLFCDYALLTVIIPIVPLLGESQMRTGVLFAAKAVFQVVFAPLFSQVIDTWGQWLLLAGLALDVASTICFALVVNYDVWLVARCVQGIASAAIIPASNGYIQKTYSHSEAMRSQAFGLSVSGIVAGVMLGPSLGGVLYMAHPSAPFMFLSFLLSITSALVMGSLRESQKVSPVSSPLADAEDPCPESPAGFDRLRQMLVCPYILALLFSLFLVNSSISAIDSTFGYYGIDVLKMNPSGIGLMYLWITVPSIVSSVFLGPYLTNHVMEKWRVVSLGLVLQGVFMMLGPKDSKTVERLTFVGMGIGIGLIDGTCPAIASTISDVHHGGSAAVHTLSTTVIQLGFTFGPLVGSFLATHLSFPGMCMIMGAALILYSPALKKLSSFHYHDLL